MMCLIIVAGFIQTVDAQSPWPSPDSEWNFAFDVGPPLYGYERYYVNGTETIQGKQCTRLFRDWLFLSNYTTGTEPIKRLHFDGDTLWHYIESDSTFYPLVCFNALPGDSWHPLDTAVGDTACSNSPMEVTDTFSVYHNGQAYRGVTIVTQPDGYIWWGGSFNERTYMDTSTFSNGHPYFSYHPPFPGNNQCSDIHEWSPYSLLCYQDSELSIIVDNISYLDGQTDCEYPWNTVSLDKPAVVENLLVYPNPTDNQVYIDVGPTMEIITINTYSALGELVLTEKRSAVGLIDHVLPKPQGVYLIQLVHTDGKVTNLKVLKE